MAWIYTRSPLDSWRHLWAWVVYSKPIVASFLRTAEQTGSGSSTHQICRILRQERSRTFTLALEWSRSVEIAHIALRSGVKWLPFNCRLEYTIRLVLGHLLLELQSLLNSFTLTVNFFVFNWLHMDIEISSRSIPFKVDLWLLIIKTRITFSKGIIL